MSKREEYEQLTEELVMPIIEQNNFELVDVEYVKEASNYYLRIYIDKEGGITVDDCEIVSRALGDLLDAKDFKRSIGMEVEIHLYKAIDRQKDYTGVLIAYSDDDVTIAVDDDKEMKIERKDIALIRLAFDF